MDKEDHKERQKPDPLERSARFLAAVGRMDPDPPEGHQPRMWQETRPGPSSTTTRDGVHGNWVSVPDLTQEHELGGVLRLVRERWPERGIRLQIEKGGDIHVCIGLLCEPIVNSASGFENLCESLMEAAIAAKVDEDA